MQIYLPGDIINVQKQWLLISVFQICTKAKEGMLLEISLFIKPMFKIGEGST